MIKYVLVSIAAFMSGAAVVAVPPIVSRPVAAVYSQSLYDCGIRVAENVKNAMISGAEIEGHDYGICIDGASRTTVANVNAKGS